jgi:hypothetical protein
MMLDLTNAKQVTPFLNYLFPMRGFFPGRQPAREQG